MTCGRGSGQSCSLIIVYPAVAYVLSRPMDEQGSRVDTEALLDYRTSHKFRGPSCLCASYEYIRVNTPYTESAIYMSTHGPYSGEYLIACAAGRCGYLSRSNVFVSIILEALIEVLQVFLDRMFGKGGLILGQYPVRGKHANLDHSFVLSTPFFQMLENKRRHLCYVCPD